jgi:hypothetical protein
MAKTKLAGSEEMQRRLHKLSTKFPDKIRGALFFRAQLIMTDSKANYVPVDETGLKSSGQVREPERGKGREISVALEYGDTAREYAIAVHEHPGPHDPPSWRGGEFGIAETKGRGGGFSGGVQFVTGGPKYLERPMMAAVPRLARDLASDLNLDKVARS